MNETLKAARLNFSLVRPYMKTILFVVAFPVVYVVMNRSLLNGISFAMCFLSMTAGYTFSISEKNSMERLYGILPVSKRHMVIGRYLYTCTMGLFALTISLIVYSIVLYALGAAVSFSDIIAAAITGIILFSLYTVFLLPGYYKYGAIKGRLFLFIPVAGYLAVLMYASKFDFAGSPVLSSIFSRPLIFAIVALLICAMSFLLSIVVSIRILRNKEV